jgi:predicted Rossmann fold flavoprotein
MKKFDLIVIGGGAAGMMAAISSSREGKKVLILEKLSSLGAKLKATGGGRCNLTNTLDNETFMEHFGKNGRFMRDALEQFDHHALVSFFASLGLTCEAKDGFRIFPSSHNAQSVLSVLEAEIKKLDIQVETSCITEKILFNDNSVTGVKTASASYQSEAIIIATGGLGYPSLGATGDGHSFAKNLGHTITALNPAMMPLHVKENWVENCRADTISKVTIKVDIPKYKKLKAIGDLIFTKKGIRGPVVLDFARELTPLLGKYQEIPILLNLTKGLNAEQIRLHIKIEAQKYPEKTILEHLQTLLPFSLCKEICKLCSIEFTCTYSKLEPHKREKLFVYLAWTPLHVTGHDGYKMAMVTRGGVSLKEIDPKTMQSKIIKGLYFCGEIVDLDGPCGGYNLQWAFSSGYLAGKSIV